VSSGKPGNFSKRIPKDKKTLHALRRLTFGPRPGDTGRVNAMGLKKWIDAQLHPEQIKDNQVLNAKLQPLDSLGLSSLELVQDYPPPQVIRQMAMGRVPYPADPERQRTIRRLAVRFEKQDDKAAARESPAQTVARVLSPDQQKILRNGTPEEKLKLIDTLPDEFLYPVLEATPQPARYALFAVAPLELQRKIRTTFDPQALVVQDLLEAKLYRAVYSSRQLEELLDDFWFNHFNVYLDKGADRFLITAYEHEAIRPHVLGKFKDLLLATAKSPAMLFYLDNWQSTVPRPDGRGRGLNENYGRELLELHTLGVDGGYTQKDVIAVARCFTGWTIQGPQRGGGFEFNDRMHDKGEKVVLGATIPAGGGMEDGLKVLDILAHHPSTARFISRKLAVRFVADNPPQSLIDKMAKTFTRTDGDIREVLKTMLESREFWSEGAWQAKVKSPLEMVAGSLRALDAQVNSAISAAYVLNQMGEPLYRKEEPTGYSSANAAWMNSAALLSRMNFALGLVANRIPGIQVDVAKLGVTSPDDPKQMARALSLMDISEQTRSAIAESLKQKDAQPAATMAGLLLGSPEFQRR
jgi:uncharacterized protein (DUF1800 family)